MATQINKLALGVGLLAASTAVTAAEKPNILAIWGDDIGIFNISAYNNGMMGYETPNIDRIANEGALFTDHYGQQSCTAGRAAFLTGQEPFRTGLLTIGMPGSDHGIPDWAPTIADLLKEQGCKVFKVLVLVAAPEGIAALEKAHPDVELYTAAIDEKLNDKGYIVPGLGDAGDKIFGTK